MWPCQDVEIVFQLLQVLRGICYGNEVCVVLLVSAFQSILIHNAHFLKGFMQSRCQTCTGSAQDSDLLIEKLIDVSALSALSTSASYRAFWCLTACGKFP